MFGSDILEVAIGLAFLFLFMSTIASAIREVIEAGMQHRAAFLERGITEMLRTDDAKDWVKDFYEHPLISSLYKEPYEKGGKLLPAYIPKESFSLAILDLAAEASQAGELLSLSKLSNKLTAIDNPNAVQRVVLTALVAGNKDLANVRKDLEDWYDGTMDRVSSWYGKRSAAFLFLIGLGSAVLLNVDTITVTKMLIVDRPLREAIVAEAESHVRREAANQTNAAEPAGGGANAPAPQPAAQDGPGAEAPAPRPAAKAGGTGGVQKQSFDELRNEFAGLGFPIGWTWSGWWLYPAPQACIAEAAGYKCPGDWWSWLTAWALAALGWLITAIAIMLGAPFWFDLLNKLVSLRSALKPPEDKPARKKAPQAANQAGA